MRKVILLPLFLVLLASIVFSKFVLPSLLPNPLLPVSPSSLLPKSLFLSLIPPKEEPSTTIAAVGDIMLGRMVSVKMLELKDWKYPFLKTVGPTSSANIGFGNLESPLVENCPTTSTGMIFCARPEAVEGLKFAGFDILSIANNHTLNYGQKGLESTKNILTESGIPFSDDNNITIKQFNNILFGFLSFDLVTFPNTPVVEKVKENISKVDVLIVSFHWGNEYQKEPAVWQKELGHQIIRAGAKVIFGHHPHVVQPVEEYQDGLIFYSLGNFVFDQPWSMETQKGQIAKVVFEGKRIKSWETIPVYIQDFCQPQLTQ